MCANWLPTWLSNQFTGTRLTDTETGQKAFGRADLDPRATGKKISVRGGLWTIVCIVRYSRRF